MNDDGNGRLEESGPIFKRSLGDVRSSLVLGYHLTNEQAAAAESDLYAWFRRFARRNGAQLLPVSSLRASLLSAASKYGHSYQNQGPGCSPSHHKSHGKLLNELPREFGVDVTRPIDEEIEE